MKSVKNYTLILEINGVPFYRIAALTYTDKDGEDVLFETDNFEEAFEYTKDNLHMLEAHTSPFKKRSLRTQDISCREKCFRHMKHYKLYSKIPYPYTVQDLMQKLSAQEFVEWAHDNHLTETES